MTDIEIILQKVKEIREEHCHKEKGSMVLNFCEQHVFGVCYRCINDPLPGVKQRISK